jgi:uncharacterized RDD family membrane protein YckC
MEYTMTPPPVTTTTTIESSTVSYAGFWRRVLAYLLDTMLCWVVFIPLSFLLGFGFWGHGARTEDPVRALPAMMFLVLFECAAIWLYFALMESSKNQGTLGKMALGLRVTDMDGNRLTFGRATGRWFAKMLSALTLCIGFIMASFTQKKQALHDMVASTLVLRKQAVVPQQVATNAFSA